MNIAFFLLPKREVITTTLHSTLRQTLERMEYHRYTSVPILSEDGKYVGTVTEGDLLWFLKKIPKISLLRMHTDIRLRKSRLKDTTRPSLFRLTWRI